MPLRASDTPRDWELVDRFDAGVGWMPYPEEGIQRVSHVIKTGAGGLLIDPIDVPELDEVLENFQPIMGVTVLMTHHRRDALSMAKRLGVPVYLPAWIDLDVDVDVQVIRVRDTIADTSVRVFETVTLPWWHEAALFDGETLVVADAVGTAPQFTGHGERVGIHPLLRVWRPRNLRGRTPERLLVGHGTGVFDDPGAAIEEAYGQALRTAPMAWVNGLKVIATTSFR